MKTKAEVLFEIDSALAAHRVTLRYHKSQWHKAKSHQWDILETAHRTSAHERVSAMKSLKRIRKAVELMED